VPNEEQRVEANAAAAAVLSQSSDRPRLLLDALILGVVGAASAQLFTWMLNFVQKILLVDIAGYREPELLANGGLSPQMIGHHGLWLVPVVTTLGGLIAGAIVYGLAPEAEGHGTDTVVKALHWTGGNLRARVAPIKMVASAITIGSGGSAGREGPTALIAAGFGSIYANLLHRPERERRLLVLMGMAAGLSAIFRSPIGTAIFAVEVLYGGMEFEAEGLMYCMLAAIVAYAITGYFQGWDSLFHVTRQIQPPSLSAYVWYVGLGAVSGLVATVLPEVFYRMRDGFHALPIPAWVKPAIGGLFVGLIALKIPQILGGGYGWIQGAIDGNLALHLLIILMVAKIVALSLTVSSGGSGGVFAPSLFVGAMLGGVFSMVSHHAPAGLVIVGMAAVFSGAARVPIATLLMVAEMTGSYALLVPAGLAVMLSFVIQTRLSAYLRYRSLYEAQVAARADSPAHRAENVQIALRLLDQGNVPLPPEMNHLHLASLLQSGVSLEFADNSRLVAGVLKPESGWVGKTVQSRPDDGAVQHSRLVAVLRGSSVLLARPDTVLQPGDRLILLVQRDGVDDLAKYLTMTEPGAAPASR
jgi:CIC family chloride channel protein